MNTAIAALFQRVDPFLEHGKRMLEADDPEYYASIENGLADGSLELRLVFVFTPKRSVRLVVVGGPEITRVYEYVDGTLHVVH